MEQVKGSMSELASELAAVREQARELASRELAAVREQEQAKCATGEQLQETLMEEAAQVQQEEDSRWAAVKKKEGVYVLDGAGRVGVGVRGEVKDFGLAAQVQRADESMNCVVELQQAVGQAKARMVSAIRSYAEAYGRSDSEEASDGEDT